MNKATMAIIVGGGPAPGINGVIGAAAIEAINNGLTVIGIYDGFSHLVGKQFDQLQIAAEHGGVKRGVPAPPCPLDRRACL